MHIARSSFLSVMIAAILAAPVYSQSTTGSILGDVVDASGASLPGATVKLLNQATGAAREALTNEVGSYRFDALPPVEYTVTVEFSGFKTVTRQNIKVPVASQVKIDFRLEISSTSETVTVTEQVPLVETTENAIKTLIDNTRIEELPLKTRDFIDLALLAPGVVTDQASDTRGSETDSVSFGGMSERFKSMWLEGVDFNDEVTGGGSSLSSATRTQLAQEAIQEFQVMANAYSAEFGRSATGVINIVTKSGTNEFHGNGFYFLRDDAFDKPNFFAKKVPPFKAEQYGATLGGPIKKDKAHFFFSYERRSADRSTSVVIPAQLVDFAKNLGYDTRTDVSVPSRFHNYFGKLTYTINPAHSLAATWVYDRRTIANTQVGGNLSADSGYNDKRRSYFFTTNLTSLLGQNTVNELRFNRSTQTLFRDSEKARPTLSFPAITFGRDNTQGRQQRNWIFSDTMSFNASRHSFRWGLEANIVAGTYVSSGNANGTFTFAADRPVNPNDPSTLPFRFNQGIELRTGKINVWGYNKSAYTRSSNIFALFFNDSWRARPNVTLTAGVRYDVQLWRGDIDGKPVPKNIPRFDFYIRMIEGDLRGQNWAPAFDDLNNFSPRVGLSWDPHNDGKTVIRLGYGLFFDQLWTETLRSIVQSYPGYRATTVTNDTRLTRIPNTFFPGYPANRSILSEQGGSSFRVPGPESESPHMQQYSVGVTREIRQGLAASFNYVYMFGHHFFITRNVNARMSNGAFPLLASGTTLNLLDTGNITKARSAQFQIEERNWKGLSARLAYTLGNINQFADGPNDNYNIRSDWGPADNDVRHRVVGNLLYHLPLGIQFGAVAQYTSSAPYNVTTGNDENRDLQMRDRPAGVGYNAARGDTNSTVDLRTSKKFAFGESKDLEVLWEMFNIFNRVNFMQYTGNMRSSQFAKPSLARDPFQAQIGLRFSF